MLVPLPEILYGIVEYKNGNLIFLDGIIASEEQQKALEQHIKILRAESVIFED